MRNDEWTLAYPGRVLNFGTAYTPVFNITPPDLGDAALRVSSTPRPRTDGVSFGTDYRGGRTVAFDLGIKGSNEVAVRDALADLATAWRADAVRSVPGAVAELRARYAGRERVTFGRPRRFAANAAGAKQGLATAVCDFETADDLWYSLTTTSAQINLVPNAGGGLLSPLASPLGTTSNSDRSVGIQVASGLPVWPRIEITGPITDPEVEVIGVCRIALRTTIEYDQTVVIDTAPWARTVLRNGVNVGGTLSRTSTRLAKAAIPPGSYEVAFRGVSDTGTAVARLSWRDSYSSL